VIQPDAGGAMNLLEVLRLARQALETARAYELIFPVESVTVEEMERWLEERIDAEPVDGNSLLQEQATTDRRAALFLAMLEMAKAGRVSLEQAECFGPLAIVPNTSSGTTVPAR
jgi:chromatin segregation and condensation protein Rec8/ScpA/Scc1 (kleisin family)